MVIILLAVCVLLFLCNFGIIGAFGSFVSNIEFGLFGFLAYIAPLFLFFGTAFGILNRDNPAAIRKLIAGIVLFMIVGMVCELIAGRVQQEVAFHPATYYTGAAGAHNGGGFFAGILTYLSFKYLGMVGTVLLILVLGLICIVLLTEKSLFDGAREGKAVAESFWERASARREERLAAMEEMQSESDAALQRQERAERRLREREEHRRKVLEEKEARRRARELAEEEAENEQILRMNRRSRGVTMDTSLTDPMRGVDEDADLTIKDNIHEIHYTGDYQDHTDEIHIHGVRQQDTPPASIPVQPEYAQEPDGQLTYDDMPEPVTESNPRPSTGRRRRQSVDDTPAVHDMTVFDTPSHDDSSSTGEVKKEQPEFSTPKGTTPVNKYVTPPITLLQKGKGGPQGDSAQDLKATALNLQKTLESFGVNAKVTDISQGPAVTRYELQPEIGVKVSRIVNLADDIKLNLAATDIRIEAPIPGKAAVGIEVPNKSISMVAFRDLIESKEYRASDARLTFAVGKDIAGRVIVTDLAKMPHLLIAGATGSGKSVCINTIIMSILYKARPDEVKLIMIDPKVVELSVYNGIPHLLLPVVTDPKKAAGALQWGVKEMTDRYEKFAQAHVRDLKGYNQHVEELRAAGEEAPEKMPLILIIVDELADLMMVASNEVEEAICRLAQLARAAGIHLIIATQRPSVDVITGLIKANMPSRIAFAVSSGVDSRTILDSNGAEKLLGKGDMLFDPQGYPKPLRVQGAFISDDEVAGVVEFLKAQDIINDYGKEIEEQLQNVSASSEGGTASGLSSGNDELFVDAGKFVIEKDKASIGMLQRVFKIGFNRAARIMDQLCEAGVVSEEDGTKPRKVLMSYDQFENYLEEYGG